MTNKANVVTNGLTTECPNLTDVADDIGKRYLYLLWTSERLQFIPQTFLLQTSFLLLLIVNFIEATKNSFLGPFFSQPLLTSNAASSSNSCHFTEAHSTNVITSLILPSAVASTLTININSYSAFYQLSSDSMDLTDDNLNLSLLDD